METKQSARELLKECREVLLRGQADEQMAMVAGIDLFLAAPSESAMETLEVVDRIRDGVIKTKDHAWGDENEIQFTLTCSKAAALIEGYGRRVPRAMLDDVAEVEAGLIQYYGEYTKLTDNSKNTIAAKYGVVIE